MKIDIWSDIACPFCYIGTTQLSNALADFAHKDQVEIVHHSFQLDPDAPETTDQSQLDVLASKKGMPIDQVKSMFKQVEASAEKTGLKIDFDRVVPVNTMLGHRLIHFAASQGKADQAVSRLFKAYFSDGQNIADQTTLVAIAAEIGLDADKTAAVLKSDDYQDAVAKDIKQAAEHGISGVPFFLVNDKYALSGAQGEPAFSQALQKVWHETHPITQLGSDQAETCVDGTCLPGQQA